MKQIKIIIFAMLIFCFSSVMNAAFAEEPILTDQEQQAKIVFDQIQSEMANAELNYDNQSAMITKEGTLVYRMQRSIVGTINKSIVRAEFYTGAIALYSAGYDMSGDFLRHSLNDTPSDLNFPIYSPESEKVHWSSAFQGELQKFKNSLPSYGTYVTRKTSVALDTPTDLKLSLHNVSITFAAQNIYGMWRIVTEVKDLYNFEYQIYDGNGISSTFITLANDYAYAAQNTGAIVPYDIFIYIQDTK